jgi:uncharacterized damage-inducible protein DinB
MNTTDFHRLLRYSDNCWSRLGEVFANVPRAAEVWNTQFNTTSRWNTIRLLLAHTIGAEQRLVTVRLQNGPLPVQFEDRAATDWDGLFQDHRTIRAATYVYLDSLTETDLEDEQEVWRIDGISLTRADILFQILNHENYHRGQVVMALQRFGLDPPDFDYVLLKK